MVAMFQVRLLNPDRPTTGEGVTVSRSPVVNRRGRTGKALTASRLALLLVGVAAANVAVFQVTGCRGRSDQKDGHDAPVRVPADQAMRDIDALLSAKPDFYQHLEGYADRMQKFAPTAQKVASLRPLLERINQMRNAKTGIGRMQVSVWEQLCKIAPPVAVLDAGIKALEIAVQRSESLLRLKDQLNAKKMRFDGALESARGDPSNQTLSGLLVSAGDLQSTLQDIDGELADLESKLASASNDLRIARAALLAVRGPLANVASGLAGALDSPQSAADDSARNVQEARAGLAQDIAVMASVIAYPKGKEIVARPPEYMPPAGSATATTSGATPAGGPGNK